MRWKPYAYYLVVLLVRGIFSNPRFGDLLVTAFSAWGRSLELLTLIADPQFEFPNFDHISLDANEESENLHANGPFVQAAWPSWASFFVWILRTSRQPTIVTKALPSNLREGLCEDSAPAEP